MHILRTADKTHRRHAITTGIHSILCRLDEARMIGKAKIVVGTEVEHCLSAHVDLGLLRTFDETFVLVEASFADGS